MYRISVSFILFLCILLSIINGCPTIKFEIPITPVPEIHTTEAVLSIKCDENELAFVSTRDGDEEVYEMNVDGTDLSNLTNNQGTDQGLAIVKRIVEQHEGTVRADSIIGEGTTMTVDLSVYNPA